jgi:kinesin family protein 18/19
MTYNDNKVNLAKEKKKKKKSLPKLSNKLQKKVQKKREKGTGGNSSTATNELTTEKFKENMNSGQSNILVAVRVRPLLKKEREQGCKNIIRVLDRKVVVLLDPGVHSDDVLRAKRNREKRYAFDYAFDTLTSQEEIYDNTTGFLLNGVLNGYNATVFAYGATGSGKTYTMLGSDNQPGLIFLTLYNLFYKISLLEDKKYRVLLSYIEIYNETIRDLLNPNDSESLDVREDSIKGVKIVGVTEFQANSVEEVMTIVKKGNKNRTQEPTNMNEESSRSHAVLQVMVEQRERTRDTMEVIKIGKLSLIDLAGSERAAVSQNRGLRLLEGANINRSLLALGNCINALGDKNYKGSYVPYRDSKLTRLLKDSLGGNCRTVMIATIAPSHLTLEDSVNTLKYANRAKNIKTKVVRNELNVNHHIAQYHKIIADLRSEITELKQKLLHASEPSLNSALSSGPKDTSTFDRLRKELVQNFDERMQIRQTILDIEIQERQNRILCNAHQIEISKLEEGSAMKTPRNVAKLRKKLSTLMQNMQKNAELLKENEAKLQKLEYKAKLIRKELQEVCVTHEMQDILGLLYKTHVLQLENLELISATNASSAIITEKDLQIQKLELQIKLRDKIIQKDRAAFSKHGIPFDEKEGYNLLKYNATTPYKAMEISREPREITRATDTSTCGLYEQIQQQYNPKKAQIERENYLKRLRMHLKTTSMPNIESAKPSPKGEPSPSNNKLSNMQSPQDLLSITGNQLPRLRGTYPPSAVSYTSLNDLRRNHHLILGERGNQKNNLAH